MHTEGTTEMISIITWVFLWSNDLQYSKSILISHNIFFYSKWIVAQFVIHSHLCVTGSVADSGLGSELNSRTSSESVGPGKKRSIEKTRSLGVVLDEDVAEPNDLSKKHQSQPNLYSTSYKSEPGHKESLLPGQQVLSKLSNKVSTHSIISL